ncbi:MAG: methyltransferase domain-containing protein [Lachnospiraceae bacterium]|nr:methyltransferase domain-containing protein [Lachnospiraceae bacterium]
MKKTNHEYWGKRSLTYSDVNKEELSGIQHEKWQALLDDEIQKVFPSKRQDIKILDIGAGPGFISIILSELGYNVTAADFSKEMLAEAEKNYQAAVRSADIGRAGDADGYDGKTARNIEFRTEDAMELSFPDESFDVVFSRNLTWNLPDPEKAYREWLRVLKKGGCLLVFDANWYAFLRDEEKRREYEEDRKNVAARGMDDYNIGENFNVMDEIADRLPLTGTDRPYWDVSLLGRLSIEDITINLDAGNRVYSEKELVNYASTPLFMLKAVK